MIRWKSAVEEKDQMRAISQIIDGLRGLNRFAKNHNLPEIPDTEIEEIINRGSLDVLGL